MIAFGPVPSRRLGHSLGVNNIPVKVCSYACVYCQIGRTLRMQVRREAFYPVEQVVEEVSAHLRHVREQGEQVDYIAFVPDGEPTLDVNLGQEIRALKSLGVPIAVITNASLIHLPDVREDLAQADWVSLKVDAAAESTWHRVNRPERILPWDQILEGMRSFARHYSGFLATETMLVAGENDTEDEIRGIAAFLADLAPRKAYIAVPTRPPAEPWVRPASEQVIAMAYHHFVQALGEDRVDYLIGYEGNAFASTGDVEQDLLSITAVHPMREEAVQGLLSRTGSSWDVVERMIREGKLIRLEYAGHTFYMRALPTRKRPSG